MTYQWKNNRVSLMHLELTNYCNAACPFCPRFVDSTDIVRPDLKLDQITLEKFMKYFPVDVLQDLKRILFCGTHGDPMMARDLIEIVKYIRSSSPETMLIFHSNGGLRKPEFWEELGNLLKNNGRVTFSIDGLEDTNHLYRRNVKWSVLMENVKAYTSTGAQAYWDYLTFKHNEHQIEEARNLAKSLNFKNFLVKRALGFEDSKGGYKDRGVYDKNGDLVYTLQPPTDESLINTNEFKPIQKIIPQKIDIGYLEEIKKTKIHPGVKDKLEKFSHQEIPEWSNYVLEYNDHEINCKSNCSNLLEKQTEIYVSCHGIVFPCCYVGTRVDSTIDLYEDTQLRYAINQEGKDLFDLNKRSLKDIINGGHLDNVYTESWKKKTVQEGKLAYCAKTCGQKSQIDKIFVK